MAKKKKSDKTEKVPLSGQVPREMKDWLQQQPGGMSEHMRNAIEAYMAGGIERARAALKELRKEREELRSTAQQEIEAGEWLLGLPADVRLLVCQTAEALRAYTRGRALEDRIPAIISKIETHKTS